MRLGAMIDSSDTHLRVGISGGGANSALGDAWRVKTALQLVGQQTAVHAGQDLGCNLRVGRCAHKFVETSTYQ